MKKMTFFLFLLVSSFMSFAQDNPGTFSYANMASMAATTGSAGLSVFVKGFYASNDGGGGFFHWEASSTLTPVPGMIVMHTGTPTGRWMRDYYGAVDVRWFGTKGDGVTDDAPAIQAAVNYAGVVNFPRSGSFFINDTIGINNSATFINGNGSKILLGSSSHMSAGAFHTGNTINIWSDPAPGVSMMAHLDYFRYSQFAHLSVGQMVLVSGPRYDSSSVGVYNQGTLAQIKAISGDTIFLSHPIDTSFTALRIQSYNTLNNIKINGLQIYSNANAVAQNIVLTLSTNVRVEGVIIHGHGSFVGISMGQCINGTIENCVIDSVDAPGQNLVYGIQVGGHDIYVNHNYVRNAFTHGITDADRRYSSSNINYIGNTGIADNLSIGGPPLDMHGNVVSGLIEGNTIVSYKSEGISIRSSGINFINNHITMVNSSGAATVKAIVFGETYSGNNEIAGNSIYFRDGPLTGRDAVSFEAGTNVATNISFHNNYIYNNGIVGNTQPIACSQFKDNYLLADTLGFAAYSLNNLTNSVIQGGRVEDKTTTGFSFGTAVSNIGFANVDISGITYYSRGKVAAIVRTGATTGVFIHDLKFYTTSAASFTTIFDQSTGLQNPQWNNYKIDSLGKVTLIEYVAAPTASALYEGKIVPVITGSGTGTSLLTYQRTGTNTYSILQQLTTAQKNAISNPAAGMIVYDVTLNKLCVYTGSVWETVTSM